MAIRTDAQYVYPHSQYVSSGTGATGEEEELGAATDVLGDGICGVAKTKASRAMQGMMMYRILTRTKTFDAQRRDRGRSRKVDELAAMR